MHPYSISRPSQAPIPAIRVIEGKRCRTVLLVQATGIDLFGDEVNAERCTAIAGAFLANPRLTDRHVVLTDVFHPTGRSIKAIKS